MSFAAKCDRCGVCFDVFNGNGFEYVSFENPRFTKVTGTDPDNYKTRYLKEDPPYNMRVDLCPGCTQEFEKFMNCDGSSKTDELRALNAQLIAEIKKMADDKTWLHEENDRLVGKLGELQQKYDNLKRERRCNSRTCRRGGCRK